MHGSVSQLLRVCRHATSSSIDELKWLCLCAFTQTLRTSELWSQLASASRNSEENVAACICIYIHTLVVGANEPSGEALAHCGPSIHLRRNPIKIKLLSNLIPIKFPSNSYQIPIKLINILPNSSKSYQIRIKLWEASSTTLFYNLVLPVAMDRREDVDVSVVDAKMCMSSSICGQGHGHGHGHHHGDS